MSMWRKYIKCKYVFMFSLKNLARKGLTLQRTVFKISAGLQTLTSKIWVGPTSFPSLSYINFGKIVLQSGKFQILFWKLEKCTFISKWRKTHVKISFPLPDTDASLILFLWGSKHVFSSMSCFSVDEVNLKTIDHIFFLIHKIVPKGH